MPRLKSFQVVAVAAMLLLTACGAEPEDAHPGQPVAKRKAVFKQIMRTLEPMGMVARNRQDYDRGDFLAGARELRLLATQPWVYFTPDSNYPPTRAKADVWQKSAEFSRAREQFQVSTERLVKAAESGDLEAIRPVVNEVEKSCQTCHRQFRSGT